MKVIVTGGSRGLGSAIADVFEPEHDVVRVGKNVCDLSKKENIDDFVAAYPVADILINCAGINHVNMDDAWAVNVRAPWELSKHYVVGMEDRGYGRIVNIGSTSSHKGFKGDVPYCTTKHALLGMSRALAEEYSGTCVNILHIAAAPSKTDMGREIMDGNWSKYIEPYDFAQLVKDMTLKDNSNTYIIKEVQVDYKRG